MARTVIACWPWGSKVPAENSISLTSEEPSELTSVTSSAFAHADVLGVPVNPS